jgi:hypothetical protein
LTQLALLASVVNPVVAASAAKAALEEVRFVCLFSLVSYFVFLHGVGGSVSFVVENDSC